MRTEIQDRDEPLEIEIIKRKIFNLTRKNKWEDIRKMYRDFPVVCRAKLTRSADTVLHLAVSRYRADQADAEVVRQLVESIPVGAAAEVLSSENQKGETALHLAAAIGSEPMCRYLAGPYKDLIGMKNHRGETPLFLAAHHGKMEAFRSLHQLYNDVEGEEPDDTLCRRKDGDTILHSAISREYFELAYYIIQYYPRLALSVNQDGISPLHILARKPNVFHGSSILQPFDRFIYRCLTGPYRGNTACCPENYETRMNFSQLCAVFRGTVPLGKDYGTGGPSSSRHTEDEENPMEGDDEDFQGEWSMKKASFPLYASGILFNSLVSKIVMTPLERCIPRIGKIKETKMKHLWGIQIMALLIHKQSDYGYDHNGEMPMREFELMYQEVFGPPPEPPEDHEWSSITEENSGGRRLQNQKREDESSPDDAEMDTRETVTERIKLVSRTKVVEKLTPFLLAAKMGITEMVKMILETFPSAIQDLDENEKNAILLAAENRHTQVYNLLLKMKPPEFVLYQLDDEGNSAVHLAAKLQKGQPWLIPGAALQIQCESKWYRHVKETLPPECSIEHNKEGETSSQIFRDTHEEQVKEGSQWIIKTSESCSLVAALIATVAFASSSAMPGGPNENTGHPILENHPAFQLFSVASLVALCFSVTALVFFLSILTSRCQQHNFLYDLPWKLLCGLSSLFTSIVAMLISFFAGHFFLLKLQWHNAAVPIYTVACFPIIFYAFAQLPLYFDLLRTITSKVPIRSYKEFYP